MRLKFVGKNGSMGLRHGKYYNVKIFSKNGYVWVKWGLFKGCPYRTPQDLAANWKMI